MNANVKKGLVIGGVVLAILALAVYALLVFITGAVVSSLSSGKKSKEINIFSPFVIYDILSGNGSGKATSGVVVD